MIYVPSNSGYYRQRAKEEADRIDVSLVQCREQAHDVFNQLIAVRMHIMAQFVAQERKRRQAWNTKLRWLPNWFHYSLDEKVIETAYPHQVLSIYRVNSRVIGAAKKLIDLCDKAHGSSVSVTQRDWKILQDYRKHN